MDRCEKAFSIPLIVPVISLLLSVVVVVVLLWQPHIPSRRESAFIRLAQQITKAKLLDDLTYFKWHRVCVSTHSRWFEGEERPTNHCVLEFEDAEGERMERFVLDCEAQPNIRAAIGQCVTPADPLYILPQ